MKPAAPAPADQSPANRERVFAFDLDRASLACLGEALPGWEVQTVNGMTPAGLPPDWHPGAAGLLVVRVRKDVRAALALCRFLASCASLSAPPPPGAGGPCPAGDPDNPLQRPAPPLVVLLARGREALATAALEAGADSCLVIPIQPGEIKGVLARTSAGNRPGRHTGKLDKAQRDDPWRETGGEG
jgi:CheY-like chemotaxis protein